MSNGSNKLQTTIVSGGSRGNYENKSQTSYSDKQSGSYARATATEKATSGDFHWKNGTSGTRSEYKQTETVRVGDKSGYTEIRNEQTVRDVTYSNNYSGKNIGGNDGNKDHGGACESDGGAYKNYVGGYESDGGESDGGESDGGAYKNYVGVYESDGGESDGAYKNYVGGYESDGGESDGGAYESDGGAYSEDGGMYESDGGAYSEDGGMYESDGCDYDSDY
ncbi:uncharacterized protein [Rutidosis leptorrhynchoides]|uniref:uncharacterized protein n=1 Tax=Rutidosis leptorrhynchoides TaxID=125765 RepID=UPI003A99D878